MRKWIFFFTVISLLAGLSACGSDRPDDLPMSMNASATQSFKLITAAGTPQSPEVVFNLTDFTAIAQYVKYIEKVDVLATSYFEFTGIPTSDGVKLTNMSLTLASNSKTQIALPDITANEKIAADTAAYLGFLQSVMDEIKRKGSSKVVLKYTSATDLLSPDTLCKISLNAKFSFN